MMMFASNSRWERMIHLFGDHPPPDRRKLRKRIYLVPREDSRTAGVCAMVMNLAKRPKSRKSSNSRIPRQVVWLSTRHQTVTYTRYGSAIHPPIRHHRSWQAQHTTASSFIIISRIVHYASRRASSKYHVIIDLLGARALGHRTMKPR